MTAIRLPSRIGVVGLGTIGVQELALWRRAGYDTIGYDVSEARVRALQGAAQDGSEPRSTVTSRIGDLAPCTVLVVCVPNLDQSGRLTMAAFDRFAREIQTLEPADRLIILASTVPLGYSRQLAGTLGPHGRLLAHAPERFDPGRSTQLGEITRVVGATSEPALEMARQLYSSAGVPVRVVQQIEVAEASKLLENTYRLLNIAFINEFAELCMRMGVSAADVVDAASSKPFAFMAHYPSAGVGGNCIPTMPQYLLEAAAAHDLDLPILRAALAANEGLAERLTGYINSLLTAPGVTRRGRVLLVGASYKPNYPDHHGSAALRLARALAALHDVVVFDPVVDSTSFPAGLELVREMPTGQTFDVVVVAVKHAGTNLSALSRIAPIFVDLTGGHLEVAKAWVSTR